jgi:hypothetical protein
MNAFDISYTTIKDLPMTIVYLGEGAGELPRHLMVGERDCGYIVKGDNVTQWYWDNLIDRGGERYLSFKQLRVLPFSSLFTTLRSQALPLLRDLAKALCKVPSGFTHPSNGFIETWRIFFLEQGGFLLLPVSLSNIISATVSDQDRIEGYGRWVKPQVEYPFGLCHQFTQFLYTACTGFAPFEKDTVREDQWRHLPLSFGFTKVQPKLSAWIDNTLALSEKDQRIIASAAYSGEENLKWWLEQTKDFTWSDPLEGIARSKSYEGHPEAMQFLQQQEKRAQRRVFWRKKGALVVSVGIAAVIVLSIFVNLIVNELKPPYTKDMGPTQIIEEFFIGQNLLDSQKMTAAFVRGLKNPFEMEVSGLFVNSKVRLAYEGKNTVVRADEWVAQGMPAVPGYAMIYGVSDVKIQNLGENRYLATYRFFSPTYEEDKDVKDDPTFSEAGDRGAAGLTVEVFDRALEFTFTDKKGYYQITSIQPVSSASTGTLLVETYQEAPSGGLIPEGLVK